MKKIIVAMVAIAAAFTMASCNKEQLVEPEKNTTPTKGNSIITASTESSLTKTSLDGNDTDGYKVVWSDGDTFKIGDNTFTLIEGANTTTGKFQGTLPEGDGPFTAYYPAEYNGSDWPTTQVYTAGNITGSPMKAEVVKGAESLSFKNEGGILRLSLNGTDQIRRIIVTADGLKDITLECGSGVTLDADGEVFHIAIPEGEYEGASISVYNTDFDGCTKKLKEGKTLKIERSKITTASFTVSFPAPAPIASLTGAFSIAEGKQVCFSRGNLYYDDGFKFESRQCNFHGYDYYSKIWGLFGWSTSTDDTAANNYGMITSDKTSDYSGKFYDWGKAIGDGETWRTLTSDEWTYLFKGREDAEKKYGLGRVYGTEGLIILPDEFTDPMKNNGSGAFVPEMGYSNSYTLGGNWEAMEAAGAVFLPIAGFRGGSEVYSVKDYGMYWSSSANGEENAYEMDFQLNSIHPAVSDARRRGHSVRLVTHIASCTVNFDMNGKTGTAPESLKGITYGSKITRPSDPTTGGYKFAGWYKDKDCTKLWNFDSDAVTANVTLYAGWTCVSDGALPGKFSISDAQKVQFSKGNMWYGRISSDAPKTFNFEDNQYDFSPSSNGPYNQDHVSYFFWSKSASVAYAKTYEDSDVGVNDVFFTNATETIAKSDFTVNEVTGKYRTLSSAEWIYLLDTRKASTVSGIENARYAMATVNGKTGLILLPDTYVHPSGVTGLVNINTENVDYSGNKYDSCTWLALEYAGAVFIPAAGLYNYMSFQTILAGVEGYYWSSSILSTSSNDSPLSIGFSIAFGVDFYFERRTNSYSVRLVTDCE